MTINFFYKPEQITGFFEANGFEIRELPFGYFNKDNKWVETNEPAVVFQGKFVKAELLFSKICERFISRMLTDSGSVIKSTILMEFDKIYELNTINK